MEILFVYGTLLDAQNQMAQFLKLNAEFYAKGYFTGKLIDLGDYPGAVLSKNTDDKVFGSAFVLKNPATVLPVLDEYEGAGEKFSEPKEFIRTKTEIITDKKEKLQCWIYLYNLSTKNLREIKSWKITG